MKLFCIEFKMKDNDYTENELQLAESIDAVEVNKNYNVVGITDISPEIDVEEVGDYFDRLGRPDVGFVLQELLCRYYENAIQLK